MTPEQKATRRAAENRRRAAAGKPPLGAWGGCRRGTKTVVQAAKPPAKPAVAAQPRQPIEGMSIGQMQRMIEMSRSMAAAKRKNAFDPFTFDPKLLHPPGVAPTDPKMLMAMDTQLTGWANQAVAANVFGMIAAEGLLFLGYPYLAELTQRPEYRLASEIIADDSTRKWIDFDVTGDKTEQDDAKRRAETDPEGEAERQADPDERRKRVRAAGKMDRVKELKDDQLRLELRDRMYATSRNDGFFGRSHLFMDFGQGIEATDSAELNTPIGDGRDAASKAKVKPKSFNAVRAIEPMWVYPTSYSATNPLSEDWYNPRVWFVMGREVHKSRMPTFVGHPVPDMLKPAYSFGGMSTSQLVKPYVDIWLNTRESIGEMIHAFSVMVLQTNMATATQAGGLENLMVKLQLFNAFRDNQGLFLVDKATEEFKNVSAPLSGLHELQAQAQEHMCVQTGTIVATARGPVAIEKMTADDRVWTRTGLCGIKWVGVTGHADTLTEIEAGLSVLRTTADHPIWSDSINEFVSAKHVTPSHRLLALDSAASTANLSRGEVDGGGARNLATTAIKRLAASFIESFGKRIEVLSQTAMNFTIPQMRMAGTTGGTISNFSLAPSTWNGTVVSGRSQNGASKSVAMCAAIGLRLLSTALNFVRLIAEPRTIDGAIRIRSTSRNASAAAESSRRNGRTSPDFVRPPVCSTPVTRVSSVKVPRQPVYNIEVDGPPEFFANGILVHNCSVMRYPVVKFTGISPAGLNASSEGEIQVYDDTVGAYQNRFFEPNLTRIINFEQLSMWGEIDPEITHHFEPLRVMTEKEKGEMQAKDAERDGKFVDMGALAPEEIRGRIIDDPDLPYAGLDPDDVPDLDEEEEAGLEPQGRQAGPEGRRRA